ncbi:lipase 2 [Fusarium beomiforme]|uniref:Lipase 2 n=1 Tax=Fusarium beomiforme TaxID=44412 RepID=A0A9P5ASD3_9HYPO|nr:lipase 2 [Fusarium beomiforme]
MMIPDPELESYIFKTAPQLDAAWLLHEEEAKKKGPPRVFSSVEERQPIYAQECRDLYAQVTAPGMRDHGLSQGVTKKEFTIPSSVDGHPIPVLQFDLTGTESDEPEVIVVFYHGGGLRVGEADSEELSCRHIVKSGIAKIRLYSSGWILSTFTADRASGEEFVPEKLRSYHTSVSPSFVTSLGGYLNRSVPRDGLEKLPLEASEDELKGHPRTWIQLTSNDPLYSDGLCYAMILREAGNDVKVQVEVGWPHTFWLKAPHLDHALICEKHMLEGLKWLVK